MGVGPRDDQASLASIGKDLDKVNAIEQYNGNRYTNIGLSDEDAEFFDTFPEDKKKAMIRKIDVRLVPVLALLYLAGEYHNQVWDGSMQVLIHSIAHIDRANIGNAKIEGMLEDLGMEDIQYNIA